MDEKGERYCLGLSAQFIRINEKQAAQWLVRFQEYSTMQYESLTGIADANRTVAWYWNLVDGSYEVTSNFYDLFDLPVERPDDSSERAAILKLLRKRLSAPQIAELIEAIRSLGPADQRSEKNFSARWEGEEHLLRIELAALLEKEQVTGVRGTIRIVSGENDVFRENLARLMLDKLYAMVLWVEPDCSIRCVNQATCKELMYEVREMQQDLTILEVDAENTRGQWEEYWEALKDQKTSLVESSFMRKDGTVFPVEMHLCFLEVDKEILVSISARDITRRRKEEAELKRALMEVNSLSRQLEAENVYLKEELSSAYDF